MSNLPPEPKMRECVRCKRVRKHNAKGMCGSCYTTVKYQTDADHPEKMKARSRAYVLTEAQREHRRAQYHAGNKEAIARRNLDSKYRRVMGVGLDDVQATLTAQGGCCAVCRIALPKVFTYGEKRRTPDAPVADHCHDTGKFRGVLCNHCNRGLAFFRDDPAAMRAAADYLEFGPSDRDNARLWPFGDGDSIGLIAAQNENVVPLDSDTQPDMAGADSIGIAFSEYDDCAGL